MKKLIYLVPLLAIFFVGCKKEEVQFNIVGTTWKGTFYQWPTTLIFDSDSVVNIEIKAYGEVYQEIGKYTIAYVEDASYPHVIFDLRTHFGGVDDQNERIDSFFIRGDMHVIQNKNGYFLDGTYAISAYYAVWNIVLSDVSYYTTYYSDFKLAK